MRIWAPLAALAVLLTAQPARADDAHRLAMARELVATRSHAAEMQYFDAILPFYTAQIEQAARLTDVEREQLPQVLREEYEAALLTAHEHAAQTYARLFSEAELQDVLDFYESATGRHFIASETELSRDSINMQQAMNVAVMQGAVERVLAARNPGQF